MRNYSWTDSQEFVLPIGAIRYDNFRPHYPSVRRFVRGLKEYVKLDPRKEVECLSDTFPRQNGCYGLFCKGETLLVTTSSVNPEYEEDGLRLIATDLLINDIVTDQSQYHPEDTEYYHIIRNMEVTGIWMTQEFFDYVVSNGSAYEKGTLEAICKAYYGHIVIM